MMEKEKNYRDGKIVIGNIQIGNSAHIIEIDENVWEEDLEHIRVKYYYAANKKDLIVEWEIKN